MGEEADERGYSFASSSSGKTHVKQEGGDEEGEGEGKEAEAEAEGEEEDATRARQRRQQKQWRANTLPRTRLSDFAEAMVVEQLKQTGYADVAPTVTVRMVSNSDNHVEVPDAIVQNMCTAQGLRVPQFLEYRQKCLLLFQTIDGVDTVLFCSTYRNSAIPALSPTRALSTSRTWTQWTTFGP